MLKIHALCDIIIDIHTETAKSANRDYIQGKDEGLIKKKKAFLFTLLGTMTTGFAIGSFLTPNKIVGGGASGISTILYHTLGIQPGVSFFVINLLFLLVGLTVLGKTFIVKTLAGITLLSGFTQIFGCIPIYTDNLILATVFGGVLYGFGIGMSFAAGASTGGTDIIGRIIQSKFPTVPIGTLLMFVDGIILLISFIVFQDIERILFGVFTLFLSGYFIDFIIRKLNISKIAFVITDKGGKMPRPLFPHHLEALH